MFLCLGPCVHRVRSSCPSNCRRPPLPSYTPCSYLAFASRYLLLPPSPVLSPPPSTRSIPLGNRHTLLRLAATNPAACLPILVAANPASPRDRHRRRRQPRLA